MPIHIVQTPLSMVQAIRENCSKLNCATFANAFENQKKLSMELEEFLNVIFYHLLQTNPREKAVVVCESFMTPRPLTEALGHVLFKNFGVKSIYFLLSNILPMYATGQDTGIVIECGFQCVQVLPIVRSRLCMESFEVCYTGGIHIEKQLNQNLLDDNKELVRRHPTLKDNLNFSTAVLEDLKTRALLVMQKDQKQSYLATPENVEKMKMKTTNLAKLHKEYPGLQISFYTRHATLECCFGDPNEEEPNLAYSILQSIKKLNCDNRVKAVQNLILSGGSCMIPGFKKRLLQEINYFIEARGEFEDLKEIQSLIKIPENCFPPNVMVWVGASLLSSLNNEIDRFLLTFDEYADKYDQKIIPDRYGEAFLYGTREGDYFNRDFEESLKIQKQILYSNTTPYSARSLASKREPIAVMMKKSMAKMEML